MELDIKKIVEEQLGYEVNNIEVEPVFVDGKFTGLSVKVEPKSGVKFIEHNITITKSGVINS